MQYYKDTHIPPIFNFWKIFPLVLTLLHLCISDYFKSHVQIMGRSRFASAWLCKSGFISSIVVPLPPGMRKRQEEEDRKDNRGLPCALPEVQHSGRQGRAAAMPAWRRISRISSRWERACGQLPERSEQKGSHPPGQDLSKITPPMPQFLLIHNFLPLWFNSLAPMCKQHLWNITGQSSQKENGKGAVKQSFRRERWPLPPLHLCSPPSCTVPSSVVTSSCKEVQKLTPNL